MTGLGGTLDVIPVIKDIVTITVTTVALEGPANHENARGEIPNERHRSVPALSLVTLRHSLSDAGSS